MSDLPQINLDDRDWQMALKSLIERKRWNYTDTRPPEATALWKALAPRVQDIFIVAYDGTKAVSVGFEGWFDADYEMRENCGLADFASTHLAQPPASGLWLWEGKVCVKASRGYEGDWDEWTEASGEYRLCPEDMIWKLCGSFTESWKDEVDEGWTDEELNAIHDAWRLATEAAKKAETATPQSGDTTPAGEH